MIPQDQIDKFIDDASMLRASLDLPFCMVGVRRNDEGRHAGKHELCFLFSIKPNDKIGAIGVLLDDDGEHDTRRAAAGEAVRQFVTNERAKAA